MPRHSGTPSYRLHRGSGQAVVTLNGRDYYLGIFGSPESHAAYDRLILEWLAAGRQAPTRAAPDLTVAEVLAAYWGHAQASRQANPERIKSASTPAVQLYGATPVSAFNGPALKATRLALVQNGYCRKYVNTLVDTLRRAFRWAVGEDLCPAEVLAKLEAVEGLRAGQTDAPDYDPVLPASLVDVRAVQAVVLPQVRDLIELQLLTGCRPGEATILRPCDVDRSADVWTYVPQRHKGQSRGKTRTIWLGPRAQAVLVPYLDRDPSDWCFDSTEAEMTRRLMLGQRTCARLARPYTVAAYSRAIRKACLRAGVPHFTPHQLRHTAATEITRDFGIETARILLGHSSLSVTLVYAADTDGKAREAMRRVG